MIKGDKARYSYDEQLIPQLFYTIQNLNDKKILNKMANMADKELNKSRDAKCLIHISMWRHCVANLNSECIIILIVTQNYSIRFYYDLLSFFCLRRKSYDWLCRLCSRHSLTLGKTKNVNREERTPKLATCPFSDAGGALAAEIQSNLQSFRALGRALIPGLLASKQRLQRDIEVSIRRRRGRRRGCPERGTCLYPAWGTFSLRGEFAEGKLMDGGRDRVMWTKGGVLCGKSMWS